MFTKTIKLQTNKRCDLSYEAHDSRKEEDWSKDQQNWRITTVIICICRKSMNKKMKIFYSLLKNNKENIEN